MLAKIKDFFNDQLAIDDPEDSQCQIEMASAALLIELSRADFQRDAVEQRAIEAALTRRFNLSAEQLAQLIALAEEENKDATSLYQFTNLIKDNYGPEQRFELVKMLWEVAVADGEISKYEDHLIRRVAELIFLPHSEFIRAKLAVLSEN